MNFNNFLLQKSFFLHFQLGYQIYNFLNLNSHSLMARNMEIISILVVLLLNFRYTLIIPISKLYFPPAMPSRK